MLSAHELAALIILSEAKEGDHLNPADVTALADRNLIRCDGNALSDGAVRLTAQGTQFLRAISKDLRHVDDRRQMSHGNT